MRWPRWASAAGGIALLALLAIAAWHDTAAAQEKSTANIDFYVAVTPVEGENAYTYSYPVITDDGGFTTATVTVPGGAFGKDGLAELSSDFDGANALRGALGTAVSGTNATYGPSNLQFTVRKIYFIKTDQPKIAPFYKADDALLDLKMEGGKSKLLKGFSEASAGKTGALRVLVGDITSNGTEQGIAQDGGTAAIVQGATLLDPRDSGIILSHEFGHLLNLPHSGTDPFRNIMAEKVPERGMGSPTTNKVVETKLNADQTGKVNTRLSSGALDGVLTAPRDRRQSMLVPPRGAEDSPQFVSNGARPVPGIPGSPVAAPANAIDAGGSAGSLTLGQIAFLRTELGKVVIDARFGDHEVDGNFSSFSGSAQLGPIGSVPVFGELSPLYAIAAFALGSMDWSRVFELDAGGNQLGILGPEGPDGFFGGGIITNANFGDVTDGYTSGNYTERLIQLGLGTGLGFEGFAVSPRVSLFYGWTETSLVYGGTTNGGNLDFEYNALLNNNRWGIQVGSGVRMPIGGGSFGIYGNADLRLVHNSASGFVGLDALLNDAPFGSESQELDASLCDVGFLGGVGVYFQQGPVNASVGVGFESWQVPLPFVTGEEAASIDWQARRSTTLEAKVGLAF